MRCIYIYSNSAISIHHKKQTNRKKWTSFFIQYVDWTLQLYVKHNITQTSSTRPLRGLIFQVIFNVFSKDFRQYLAHSFADMAFQLLKILSIIFLSLQLKNTLWMMFNYDRCQMTGFNFPNHKIDNSLSMYYDIP